MDVDHDRREMGMVKEKIMVTTMGPRMVMGKGMVTEMEPGMVRRRTK